MLLSYVHLKFSSLLFSITLFFFLATTADTQLPAFPTAEGFGKNALGGRDGDVKGTVSNITLFKPPI
jgi:hypothetical protein